MSHVGWDVFYGAPALLWGRLFGGARVRRVLLCRQRTGQRAAQPAGCGATVAVHDKVGGPEAKARAAFDYLREVALGIEVEEENRKIQANQLAVHPCDTPLQD